MADLATAATTQSVSSTVKRLAVPVLLPSTFQGKSSEALQYILPLFCHEDLQLSATATGVVVSVQSLAQIGAAVPAGKILAQISCYHGFCLGYSILISSTLIGYVSSSWPALSLVLLFASRVCMGLGQAISSLCRSTMLSAECPQAVRGRVSALTTGLNRWIAVPAIALSGMCAERFGNSSAFLLQGALVVAALLCVVAGRFCAGRGSAAGARESRRPVPVSAILRQQYRVVLTVGVFCACLSFLRASFKVYLPLQARAHGLSRAATTGIAASTRFVEGLMFPLGGYMSDSLGRAFLGVTTVVLVSLAFAAMPFASSYGWLTVASIPYALGNGLAAGLVNTLGCDSAPPEARSEFLSVWRLITNLGQYLGPPVVGIFSDVQSLEMSGWVCSCLALASGLLLYWNRAMTTLHTQPQPESSRALAELTTNSAIPVPSTLS